MSVGIVMLVHTALDRAAQIARHFATAGCPVVIHTDRKVPAAAYEAFARAMAQVPGVEMARRRHRCDWGTWGIVGATQDAAAQLLAAHSHVRHVYLASGSCLPLRPMRELIDYLGDQPELDFIESVTIEDVVWTKGGFDHDRFRLLFPFSFRKHRRLFDATTALQRRLRLQRRLPPGLVPHLGSQWWCLSRPTLEAILNDPDRPALDRFFRRVWIPDESYFQTLVRRHGRSVESRSLTLAKFDHQGKPHTFYDDHLQLLRRSDCFVARKIWPRADKLYAHFLSDKRAGAKRAEPNPGKIDRTFSKATARRLQGRAGLTMQSRFPAARIDVARTAAPYSVFAGFAHVFDDFERWLTKTTGLRVHGHLFAPGAVEFAGRAQIYNGGLSSASDLRDYDAKRFLANLIWATRGERQCFMFGPADTQSAMPFIAGDPNAQVSVIAGAWALSLHQQEREGTLTGHALRKDAARLQRIELKHLELMRASWVKARVRIWTLAEFLDAPMDHLAPILDELTPRAPRRPTEAPTLRDTRGFAQFLQRLKNDGMFLHMPGDFSASAQETAPSGPPSRPYLVR
ncbi:MAG: beta-1,6-N-acetylglucosaminyltransferase [Pseudomonadota bacterium]